MFPIRCKTKNGDEYIIRKVTETDAKALIDYLNVVGGESDFLTFGKGEFKKSIEDEVAFIKEANATEGCLFIVAETAGRIIAVLNAESSTKPRIAHVCEFGISVLKQYWGQGVGSRLIQAMIDWAKAGTIIRKINLVVHAENTSAIELYKKFGFVVEGTLRRDAFINGKFFDSLAMGLLVD